MDQTALHEEDIYAWSQHQARVLRGLARTYFRPPNDLDLEHVAEEIEDAGDEQRFAVESDLIRAFLHLIKTVALPGGQAARHWTKGTHAFLYNASRRYHPSMRRDLDHEKLWSDAVRLATENLGDDGHAVPPLPVGCPFALEELVGGEANPRDLAPRLSAAVAASKHSSGA